MHKCMLIHVARWMEMRGAGIGVKHGDNSCSLPDCLSVLDIRDCARTLVRGRKCSACAYVCFLHILAVMLIFPEAA